MNTYLKAIIFWLISLAIVVIFFWYMVTRADYYNEVKFGKYMQAIIVHDKQVDTLVSLWYDTKRIIDLITLGAMECSSYEWTCKNWTSDIWNMQINQTHEKEYKKSLELYNAKKRGELYLYQVQYAKNLVDSYEIGNCSEESFNYLLK